MFDDKLPGIAVGSAGSATGYCAVNSLRRSFGPLGYRIIACDINPAHMVAASSISDDFIKLPHAGSPEFASSASQLLAERNIVAYYPLHDEEIRASASMRHVFQLRGVSLCAPEYEAVIRATDKAIMSETLRSVGITVPQTWLLSEEVADLPFPIMLKPRFGVGSHGVLKIEDPQSLQVAFEARRTLKEDYILQEWLDQPEVTVDAFLSSDGADVFSLCRERVEIKAGISTKSRLFQGSSFDMLSRRVGSALAISGSFCFQFRHRVGDGVPAIIDVNPRIGGATAMSVAIGMDFPSAHVAMHLGLDRSRFFVRPDGEFFVTRSFREHVARVSAT